MGAHARWLAGPTARVTLPYSYILVSADNFGKVLSFDCHRYYRDGGSTLRLFINYYIYSVQMSLPQTAFADLQDVFDSHLSAMSNNIIIFRLICPKIKIV